MPEFTQTHVRRVADAIQPPHPLSAPSPHAFNLSQYQGLFKWVSSSCLEGTNSPTQTTEGAPGDPGAFHSTGAQADPNQFLYLPLSPIPPRRARTDRSGLFLPLRPQDVCTTTIWSSSPTQAPPFLDSFWVSPDSPLLSSALSSVNQPSPLGCLLNTPPALTVPLLDAPQPTRRPGRTQSQPQVHLYTLSPPRSKPHCPLNPLRLSKQSPLWYLDHPPLSLSGLPWWLSW